MKLVKKLISAMCVMGMVATMASALVVQAATTPTLKIEVNNYNETDKTGTMVVKVLDIDKSVDERPEDLFVAGIQVGIKLPSETFDQSYYKTGKGGKFSTNVKMGSRFSSDVTGPKLTNGVLTAVFATTSTDAGKMLNSYNGDDVSSIEFMTINFKLLTDSIDVNDLIDNVMITTRHYDTDWATKESEVFWGNMKDCTVMNYDLAKIGTVTPAKPSVPTNTGATADSSAILNVKPSDVGGTGDVWASADGSENAVAGLANFTPSAATSTIEWTISATPVGGEATQYRKAFDLGASIDAAATIGLIVNYNTAEYSSVSIVSGALK